MKYGAEPTFSFVRSVVFSAPGVVVATAFWGLLSLLVSPFDHRGRKQALMARLWARTLLLLGWTRVKVIGRERLRPGQHYIFAANHRSYMDTPVVLASLPGDFRFMAKAGLFKIPLLGGHLQRAGHVPVVLDNPREAVRAMNDASRIIRETGISVLIFPEGGRTMGQMDPFREGAAFLGIKSGVPIVPVGLIGTQPLLPMHSVHLRWNQEVIVHLGEPIETAGLDLKQRGPLTDRLAQEVARLISLY